MGFLLLTWGLPAVIMLAAIVVVAIILHAAIWSVTGTYNLFRSRLRWWKRIYLAFLYPLIALSVWGLSALGEMFWDRIQKDMWEIDNPVATVGYETHRVRLVDQNPPKHYQVRLHNLTLDTHEWLSVSKHCNNWRDNQIGDEYNINMIVKEQAGRRWLVYPSLKPIFC